MLPDPAWKQLAAWGTNLGWECQTLVHSVPACADTELENTADVTGRIVVIERGIVPFTDKVRRAVEAGAAGVIITDGESDAPDEINFELGGDGAPVGGFPISVAAVAFNSRRHLQDGDTCSLRFDEDVQDLHRDRVSSQEYVNSNLMAIKHGVCSTVYPVAQKLIVVKASYRIPAAVPIQHDGGEEHGETTPAENRQPPVAHTATSSENDSEMPASKLCSAPVELTFGDRQAYVRGLDEIVFEPPLTMAQEMERDDKWTDWAGTEYSALREYQYVAYEEAVEQQTPVGWREKSCAKFTLSMYIARINDFISTAGGDELTRDEVIACRLYTGPMYQKINGFLRNLGRVDSSEWRLRLAQMPGYTYSATVAHLTAALRKLSAIDSSASVTEEAPGLGTAAAAEQFNTQEKLLYRGVKGKLPASFFVPDAQGMITAVDAGFMSTSDGVSTPLQYMDSGVGVLFVMHCAAAEDSTGEKHTGGLLQLLSQYPAETETLFPPLTMLSVMKDEAGSFMIFDKVVDKEEGKKLNVKEIHVVPCFV